MLGFLKKVYRSINKALSILCLLMSFAISAETQTSIESSNEINIQQFDQVAEQVTVNKRFDLSKALEKLTAFEPYLDKLSIEQNLRYYKLLSEIQIEKNKYSLAKDSSDKGLVIAKRLASPSIFSSELLYLKGFAYQNLGEIKQAERFYKQGLEVAESLHNKINIALGLIHLGNIAYLQDDANRAFILLNDAFKISGQTDDEQLKGAANNQLGKLYSHLQQDMQSMPYYQQSYYHYKNANMPLAAHNSLNNIATTHINNKNYPQAIAVFYTIINESNENTPSDRMYAVYSGIALAHAKKTKSNPEKAYEYLLKAKEYLQVSEQANYQLQFYLDEANILYQLKRFDEALMSIAKVERILGEQIVLSHRKKETYLSILNLKADVFYHQGKFQQAYDTKSKILLLTDKLYENEDNLSIEKARLKLEAEQADKLSKTLNNQKKLYEEDLNKANFENEQQRFYLIVSALVALAFAWILVKLIQNQHKLNIASSIDTLTNSPNRRSLLIKSQDLFNTARQIQRPLSILILDIDHFKLLNDRYGHSVGDDVLVKISELISNMIRKSDVFGRFGGEEFMISLPNTGLKSAIDIGERMRQCVNDTLWNIPELQQVNVSIGVASFAGDVDLMTLINRADEQLLQAKASGRNKVCGQ